MDRISTIFLASSLIIIMLGMGLSLVIDDFKRIFVYPKAIIVGLTNQLIILPLIGISIAFMFPLRPEIAIGIMIAKGISNINSISKLIYTAQTAQVFYNTNLVTDVNEIAPIPFRFELFQNYPNPFNSTTIIKYSISVKTNVELKVFDILGREIKTLVNEEKDAGSYKLKFNGGKLSSGIYFYRLKAGDFLQTKKLLYLK